MSRTGGRLAIGIKALKKMREKVGRPEVAGVFQRFSPCFHEDGHFLPKMEVVGGSRFVTVREMGEHPSGHG